MWCFIVLKYSLTLILYYEPYIMCKMKIIMLLKSNYWSVNISNI